MRSEKKKKRQEIHKKITIVILEQIMTAKHLFEFFPNKRQQKSGKKKFFRVI